MSERTNYKVTVAMSSRELTGRETIAIKDTSNAIKLDEATQNGSIELNPQMYAVLSIHNEKSANPDYEVFVVVDDEGNKYVTGSNSFFEAFQDIFEALAPEEEPYTVIVSRMPSKNYSGKSFLTCSLKL